MKKVEYPKYETSLFAQTSLLPMETFTFLIIWWIVLKKNWWGRNCVNARQLILLLCVWGCLMNTENTYRHLEEFSLWAEVQTAWVVAHGKHIADEMCSLCDGQIILLKSCIDTVCCWAPVDTASIKIWVVVLASDVASEVWPGGGALFERRGNVWYSLAT